MSVAKQSGSRCGSTYVLILGLSALVMTMAVGAIAVARIQARHGQTTQDVAHARLYAGAAIEMGRFLIKSDSDWRDHYPNGVWGTDVTFGAGAGTLEVIDPNDGDLTNDDLHPVVLTGTGTKALAVRKTRVTLLARAEGYGCLETALFAANDLNLNSCTVQCDGILGANNSINASGADVYADAEAANDCNGSTYHGMATAGVDDRSMPDEDDVFDTYESQGVVIPPWAIPWADGALFVDEVIFSPGHNPYWPYTTSANGVYVIDCAGSDVCIRDCRIVGTIVLRKAGSGTRIQQAVNWKPAVAHYPALLVEGSLAFRENGGALDEDMENENYNPAHTPYDGHSDNDQRDQYPSRIEGLIYVANNAVAGAGVHTVHGVIVVGNSFTAEPGAVLNLRHDTQYVTNPPTAFRERVLMEVAPGSWQRVVD